MSSSANRIRRCALVLGVTLAAATATLPAMADPAAFTAATPTTTTVTLVTGEQVTVTERPGERPDFQVRQAPQESYQTYQDATGDYYVIPAIAQAYLGHGLDRSLFDVSALVRDGLGDTNQLPVSLTYAAGATPTTPAGITLDGTDAGYLTRSSESAFAAALHRRIGADIAAGRPAGTTPLVPGLTGITLAAAGAPPVVTPFYPLYTLQLDVTDRTGAPLNGDAVLLDTDALAKEGALLTVVDGVARIQAPAGDYSVLVSFDDFDSAGNLTATRQVVVEDFTVQATGGVQHVAVSEDSATTPITAKAPRPTDQALVVIQQQRGDTQGNIAIVGDSAEVPLYVNPSPAPKVGTLRMVVFWTGTAPHPADRYLYSATFAVANVPADETYVVRPDQVATVYQHITSDPAATATTGEVMEGYLDPSTGSGSFGWAVPAPMPGTITHYFGTADGGQYRQAMITPSDIGYDSPFQTFVAGHQYTEDWDHGPLTVGVGRYTGLTACVACIAGSTLYLNLSTENDSDPGHFGRDEKRPTAESLTFYQNGTQVFSKQFATGVQSNSAPQVPTVYRAVLDMDYTGVSGISQSLVTSTDVTFTYDPATDPAPPGADTCLTYSTTPVACHILPILTANYQLAGLDRTNTTHAPVQLLRLGIGHQSYDGIGSRSPITSTALSISWDHGSTWQPVPLAGSAGHYVAAWPNHAGTGPELKVTASDAAGDTLTQTVSDAYTIGSMK